MMSVVWVAAVRSGAFAAGVVESTKILRVRLIGQSPYDFI